MPPPSKKKKKRVFTQEEEFELLANEAKMEVTTKRGNNKKRKKKKVESSSSSSSSSSSDSDSSSEGDVQEPPKKKKRSGGKNGDDGDSPKKRGQSQKVQVEDVSSGSSIEEEPPLSKKKAASPKRSKSSPKRAASPKRTAFAASATPPRAAKAATATSASKKKNKAVAARKSPPRSHTKRAPPASSLVDNVDIPLPPSQLLRTQSTPLEIELQNQVMANANADLASKPPPYTKAPPKHLLKFAPREAEEGYEVQDDDAEDEIVEEANTSKWTLQQVHTILLFLCWGYVAVVLIYGVMIPSSKRSRAKTTPRSLFLQCYRNNVHTKEKYMGACAHWEPEELLDCPDKALCWGGTVHDCRFGGKSQGLITANGPDYYELTTSKQCVWSQAVNDTVSELTDTLQILTLAHICRRKGADKARELPYPKAAWTHNATELPLFQLTDAVQNLTNPPFNISHTQDRLQFVKMIAQGDPSLLVVDTMPALRRLRRMFGIRKSIEEDDGTTAVHPGTPLVGLVQEPTRPWYMMSLPIQCWWNNMPLRHKSPRAPRARNETKQNRIKGAPKKAEARPKEESDELKKAVPRGAMTSSMDDTASKKMSTPGVSKMSLSSSSEETVKPKQRLRQSMEKEKMIVSTKSNLEEKLVAKPLRGLLSGLRNVLDRFETLLFLNSFKRETNATKSSTPPQRSSSLPIGIYLYPLGSLIAFFSVAYIQYKQKRAKMLQAWCPEIASAKGVAIQKIQDATNGGWIVTHLRDAVIVAMEEDTESLRYDHLLRHIWPRVLDELLEDERLKFSEVVSNTTGQTQPKISWREDNQASSNNGDDVDDDDDDDNLETHLDSAWD